METGENNADPDLATAFDQEIPKTYALLRFMGAKWQQHRQRTNLIPMLSPSMEMRAGLDEETSGPNFFGTIK